MSDTPRTNALFNEFFGPSEHYTPNQTRALNLCSMLERELTAHSEISRIRNFKTYVYQNHCQK